MRAAKTALCGIVVVFGLSRLLCGNYSYTGECCNLIHGCAHGCAPYYGTGHKSDKVVAPQDYPGCTTSHEYPDDHKACLNENPAAHVCGRLYTYSAYDCPSAFWIGVEDQPIAGCDAEFSDNCDAYIG